MYLDPSPKRGDPDNTLLFKIAQMLAQGVAPLPGSAVTSFNGRTGAVTLLAADVTGALGYTPLSEAAGDARYVLKAGDTMTGSLNIANSAVLVASDPALDITQTWNNAGVTFTGLAANYTVTAASTNSNFFNFQLAGVDRFNFTLGGVFRAIRHDQSNSGLTFFMRKRGNSVSADGAMASDATIAVISFSAWDGTTFSQGAHIDAVAGEAWTSIARGSRILFYTTPNGSTTDQITLRLGETGQTLIRDGTAALPTLSFQTDTDTGLYRIGANVLGASVAGARVSSWNATGFGVGVDAALSLLHIESSVADSARMRIVETGDTTSAHFSGVGYYDGATFKSGVFKRGNDHALCFFDATQTRITMLQGGFTGISEPVPARVLHVTSATADAARMRVTEMSDTASTHFSGYEISDQGTFKGGIFKQGDNHSINIFDALLARITVLQGGNVGVGTNNPSTGFTLATAVALAMNSGVNQRAGNATLVGGTVTVNNTTVTANTLVILTRKTAGGTLGNLTYTLSAATSFTINSDSGTDTSTVSYTLIEVP